MKSSKFLCHTTVDRAFFIFYYWSADQTLVDGFFIKIGDMSYLDGTLHLVYPREQAILAGYFKNPSVNFYT